MELKTYFAQDDQGNALSHATCFLYDRGTETLAAGLQTRSGMELTNPFSADSVGRIEFAAPNGLYDLRVVKLMRDYRISIQLLDLNEALAAVSAQADRASNEADRSEAAVAEADKFQQDGSGAVVRSLREKLKDLVCLKDFGAIGDGKYHPLSEVFSSLALAQQHYATVPILSLEQSIDWAALQAAAATGRVVYGPAGKYVITDPVIFPNGSGFIGDGCDRWTPYASTLINDESGTQLIAYGDVARTFKVRHISNCETSGGVLVNPSAADPYTATAPVPKYSLQDFTYADAAGATAATSKPFSALLVMTNGGRGRFENFRYVPWNGEGGQHNYKLNTSSALGAKWDVGLWLHNTSDCYIHNVQGVGYWRIAASLKTIAADTDNGLVQGESDHFSRCVFQGFVGFMARSYDLHRVVAVGASSLSIPWSASHQFPPSGTIRVSGTDKAYASLTFDGNNLVFGGLDVAGVTTSSEVRIASSSFGSSGTVVDDCYINSLGHHSMLSATSNALLEADGTKAWNYPSSAIEISGEPNRAYIFNNCTVISNDDRIVHFHNSRDMDFNGTYFEAKPSRSVIGSSENSIPAGCRWIATRQTAGLVPAPAGYTSNLRSRGHSDNGAVDFRPTYDAYPSNKYASGNGYFYPREVQIDKYNFPVASDGRMQIRSENDNVSLNAGGVVDITHGNGQDVLVRSRDGLTAAFRTIAPTFSFKSTIRHNFGNTAGDVWYTADASKFYGVGGSRELGLPSSMWAKSHVASRYYTSTLYDSAGTGSPEGVVAASVGSTYRRTNGGASSCFYVKESGTGNTGWVAK